MQAETILVVLSDVFLPRYSFLMRHVVKLLHAVNIQAENNNLPEEQGLLFEKLIILSILNLDGA